MINKHYKTVKTALRKGNIANEFDLGKYGFSPYSACQHGCVYCDGRAEKYYIDGEFDKDIVIRQNLPELLFMELPKLKEPGFVSIGSGVSDAYQNVEKEEEIMKRCSEILVDAGHPVSLLTKSSLAMRDINAWKKVHEKNGFLLMVSLTFLDDSLRKTFEPSASPVQERLDMIKAFKEAGTYVGVLAMPFIPFISDTPENMRELFRRLKTLKVDFIMPGGLTLRPGRQKDVFVQLIESKYPEHLKDILEIYHENRPSGNTIYRYRTEFNRVVRGVCSEFDVPVSIPHYIYRDRIPLYDEIYILLKHMQYLYSFKGIDTKRLDTGIERYRNWLKEAKSGFNRSRKLKYTAVEDRLKAVADSGEMTKIIQNERLAVFLKQVVIDRKIFDYTGLKLE